MGILNGSERQHYVQLHGVPLQPPLLSFFLLFFFSHLILGVSNLSSYDTSATWSTSSIAPPSFLVFSSFSYSIHNNNHHHRHRSNSYRVRLVLFELFFLSFLCAITSTLIHIIIHQLKLHTSYHRIEEYSTEIQKTGAFLPTTKWLYLATNGGLYVYDLTLSSSAATRLPRYSSFQVIWSNIFNS